VDLRQLEIFVKVAELGSFSRAAQALFLTQPTVSEHIRTLEDELGVRLLDRLGRGAAVTKGGALLLGYAQRMLALSREARGPLLAAAPEYLEAAFEEIDSAHGSFDGYLYERLGVTESALEQMRAHLLED